MSLDNGYYLDVNISGKDCTVLDEGYEKVIQDSKILSIGPPTVNTVGGESHKVLGCISLPYTVQNKTQKFTIFKCRFGI